MSIIIPYHASGTSTGFGYRRSRPFISANIDTGNSLNSLINAPVNSKLRTLPTSSGVSSGRNRISESTSPNFSRKVIFDSCQVPSFRIQCIQVARVVSRNCLLVLRIIAHLDDLLPSFQAGISRLRRRISTQHPVDLADPIGPMIARWNAFERMNLDIVGVAL